jgi:hypothetical protein
VLCTGSGWLRLVKECLARRGGAEGSGEQTEGEEEWQQAIMGQSGAGVRERGARSLTAGGGGESVASVRRRG